MKATKQKEAARIKYYRVPLSEFPQKRAIKIEIAKRIAAYIRDTGTTQTEVAVKHNIDQGVMSRICNANLDGFTVDRLMGVAETIGVVVDVNFTDSH